MGAFKRWANRVIPKKKRQATNRQIQQTMLVRNRFSKLIEPGDVNEIRRQVYNACMFDSENVNDFRAVDIRLPPKKKRKQLFADEEEMTNGEDTV